MFWLKLIKKLLKALNAESSPSEIAGGVVLGSILGLTPFFALHNLIVVILLIILKVNISAAIFASIIFGVIGYAVDPLAHLIGQKVLLAGGLRDIWTVMYNVPVIGVSKFNNTVVMGSLIISFIIMLPLFLFSKKFVVVYRERIQEKLQKLKIVKILKATKIYNLFRRVKI